MREHDNTSVAREVLGTQGITATGHAYAWCQREQGYHVTFVAPQLVSRITRYDLRPDIARERRVRMTLPPKASSPLRRRGTRKLRVDATWLRIVLRTGSTRRATLIHQGMGL